MICSIPVYAVLSAIVTPLFKKRLDEKFEAGANTQSFLVESITGVQTVKSYALEPKFEKNGAICNPITLRRVIKPRWFQQQREQPDSLSKRCSIC